MKKLLFYLFIVLPFIGQTQVTKPVFTHYISEEVDRGIYIHTNIAFDTDLPIPLIKIEGYTNEEAAIIGLSVSWSVAGGNFSNWIFLARQNYYLYGRRDRCHSLPRPFAGLGSKVVFHSPDLIALSSFKAFWRRTLIFHSLIVVHLSRLSRVTPLYKLFFMLLFFRPDMFLPGLNLFKSEPSFLKFL